MSALKRNTPKIFVLGNKNRSAEIISPIAIIVIQSLNPYLSKFSAISAIENFPIALNRNREVSNPARIHPVIFLPLLNSVFIILEFKFLF